MKPATLRRKLNAAIAAEEGKRRPNQRRLSRMYSLRFLGQRGDLLNPDWLKHVKEVLQ